MYIQCSNYRWALNPIINGTDYLIMVKDDVLIGHYRNMYFDSFRSEVKGLNLKVKERIFTDSCIINGDYGVFNGVELEAVDVIPADRVETTHWSNEPLGKIFRVQIDRLDYNNQTAKMKEKITKAKKAGLDYVKL